MDFIYCQNPEAEVPIILIDKHIGVDADAGPGIMAEQYVRELHWLNQMGNKKSIENWINSVGGSVMDAMAIYNANLLNPIPVDTVVIGVAASSAGVIAQSGRKRKVMDNALGMYHEPFNPEDPEDAEQSESLKKFKSSIITMLCERCGLSEKKVAEILAATTWMDASEMLANGMCDEVIATKTLNTIPKTQNVFAAWKQAKKYVNQLVNDKKTIKMSKVANKLKLNSEASEDAILSEIDKIENASKHMQTKHDAMKQEYEDAKKELDALKEKMKAYEEKMAAKDKADEEAKAKAEEEAAAALKDRAEAYVNAAIKIGKIAASAKDSTVKNYISNEAGTKELIDSIPVNGKAVKIESTANKAGDDGKGAITGHLPTSANVLMAEIMNKNPKKY